MQRSQIEDLLTCVLTIYEATVRCSFKSMIRVEIIVPYHSPLSGSIETTS